MTNDLEVERLMDLVGALVQANVAQVQHCTKHKAFSEELGTQQRAAYIAVQDELERLVADARRWQHVISIDSNSRCALHECDPTDHEWNACILIGGHAEAFVDAEIAQRDAQGALDLSANPLAEPKETQEQGASGSLPQSGVEVGTQGAAPK